MVNAARERETTLERGPCTRLMSAAPAVGSEGASVGAGGGENREVCASCCTHGETQGGSVCVCVRACRALRHMLMCKRRIAEMTTQRCACDVRHEWAMPMRI